MRRSDIERECGGVRRVTEIVWGQRKALWTRKVKDEEEQQEEKDRVPECPNSNSTAWRRKERTVTTEPRTTAKHLKLPSFVVAGADCRQATARLQLRHVNGQATDISRDLSTPHTFHHLPRVLRTKLFLILPVSRPRSTTANHNGR
jgi:hypothetical protein